MFKQKPFPFSIFALLVLITLHFVGSYYSLYWAYSWFDIVVHTASGMWAALVILWLASCMGQIKSLTDYKLKSFFISIISALLIGVAWELLEIFTRITFVDAQGYTANTASDLLGDSLGGMLAYLYFIRRRKCTNDTCDVLHPFYNQTGIIKK